MATIPYKILFERLTKQGIDYLVAGGFAVNFYQVQRATVDLDLIVRLEKKNIEHFVDIMNALGYVPRLPVDAKLLGDEKVRASWIKEKNMMVFSFYNKENNFEVVDVFVDEFKPFLELKKNRTLIKAFGIEITVVGLDDLKAMKRQAGREKDLFDLSQLEKRK